MENATPLEPLPFARLDPRRVRKALASASPARTDDWLSVIDTLLAERLDDLLFTPGHILEVSRRPGQLATLLQQRHPKARVVSMGLVPPVGPKGFPFRLPWQLRPVPVTGDPGALPFPPRQFDMVLSNMMLHWTPDPMASLRELRRVLKPGGALLLCAAGEGTLRELKTVQTRLDQTRHGRAWIRVPEFLSLHQLGEMLAKAGFSQPVADRDLLRFTRPDGIALLHELRRMGAANAHRQRPAGLMGTGYPARLAALYQENFGLTNGAIPVTLEILFGHAWSTKT
ncbi:MAG: methyltransferase domain-containing protein [Magnetococcales bacterium]|nr:methyltransferase domain-containing protein [Magnetococcales bacterium]